MGELEYASEFPDFGKREPEPKAWTEDEIKDLIRQSVRDYLVDNGYIEGSAEDE